MVHGKKSRSKLKSKYGKLIGKTKDEAHSIIHSYGFVNNENGIYTKKTSLFSNVKLELDYVKNTVIMVVIYEAYLNLLTYESTFI